MTRARRPSVALLLAALLVVPAGTAVAHDRLIGSTPEDGSTVEAPDQVQLTFSGAIGDLGAQVAVTDGDGRSVVEGDPEVDGTVVGQDLVDDLASGDYAVIWRVTSEDGHPISGELTFTVEESQADAADATTSADDTATAAPTADATSDDATQAVEETAGTSATDGTDDAGVTADPAQTQGVGGLPVWAWVVVALAGVGVAGLLARTWSRGRE